MNNKQPRPVQPPRQPTTPSESYTEIRIAQNARKEPKRVPHVRRP